ncbi:cupin domain-containing protein [Aridibaculum aurantiacum]|uniref:cupin domain-containing protein n=1 Tax=Aridibaculum aurantiacum TaxID=2810307 RepID=UPI001A97B788|nr:cupin domain-containing protein [Aridibaculum aurantiacum]
MNTTINQFQPAIAADYRDYQGGYFKVLIDPKQTNGTMALLDMTLPKGVEPPPHYHTNEDETFYLLEGSMSFHIGEEKIVAKQGDAVFAPRQVPHHFIIKTETVRFLNLITPGQFLEYFLEYSYPSTELSVVPPQGPPPAEAIMQMTNQLKSKYGVLFL